MEKQFRVAKWDNVRFFMILLVVIGHFVESLMSIHDTSLYKSIFVFIYSFHMPVFFFLAGSFHKNTNIRRKCLSYILAGFLCKIGMSVSKAVFVKGLASISFSLLTEKGLPWFMFAMAAYVVMTYLLHDRNPWFILCFCILISMFAGYDGTVGDYMALSRIIVFFPFYWMGYIIDIKRVEEFSKNRIIKLIAFVVIIGWGLMCIFLCRYAYALRPLFTGRNSYAGNFESYGAIVRLFTYLISVFVGAAVIIITPDCKIPLISLGGSRTLQVYFWHRIVIYALTPIMPFFAATRVGRLLWLCIGIVVAFVLIWKPLQYPLALCFRTKKDV